MKKFEKIFFSMIAMIMMVAVGSVFTSCTNDDDDFRVPAQEAQLDQALGQDSLAPMTRSATSVTYNSTPTKGYNLSLSSIDIGAYVNNSIRTYHGGIIKAFLRNTGSNNQFTVRITKQGGGVFTSNGVAEVRAASVNGGLAGSANYYSGDSYVDVTFYANFTKGYVHFYPITNSGGFYSYSEPLLVYTSPMYYMKSSYIIRETLGTANGVIVKASDSDLLNDDDLDVQCTEFCHRYYSQVYNVNVINTGVNGGHAETWFGAASSKHLESHANGTITPRPGDILCCHNNNPTKHGHVAIIMEVTGTYIKVAQQNAGIPGWDWQHPIGGELNYNSTTKMISNPNGMTVDGILRVPAYYPI